MMGALHLKAVATALGANYDGPASPIVSAVLDSRQVRAGDLFVAHDGEHVDGHDFIAAAAEAGATAALVARPVSASIPLIEVPDTLAALTTLARENRAAYSAPLIAITGSCGKTSVKNICRSIFERLGSTVATTGNYNNELGVPLTLSRISDATQFSIVEMGATRRGDIEYLCSLARPSITTVLNAMEAHLDGFGSVEAVADVKAEIYDGLDSSSVAILNVDGPWASLWRDRISATGASLVTYSTEGDADVKLADLEDLGLAGSRFNLLINNQSQAVSLPLPGRHNVTNALAAAALATAAGVSISDIAAGLQASVAEDGRLTSSQLADGTILIDDSYNANPGSVRAAIDLLEATAGRRMLILGEMLELGGGSADAHYEIGARAAAQGVDILVAVGDAVRPAAEAFGSNARWYHSQNDLRADAQLLLDAADTILVKGSRGSAMEQTFAALKDASGNDNGRMGGGAC